MSFIEMKNIRKDFGKLTILHGVDMTLEKGEVISIIGPSGAGKSTLLRCLNHLETIQGGSIAVDGEFLAEDKDGKVTYASEAKTKEILAKMGMVFQSFNLFPQYSVLKNVTLAPVLLKRMTEEEAEKKARELIARVGLTDRINNYPCQLSGGQQQRVAIARALALEPDILCFDEPTSALDPELTGEVLRVIKDLKSTGSTMIVVTHEMELARNVSDKVLFMADGVVEESGTPEEVFGTPQSDKTKSFLNKSLESV